MLLSRRSLAVLIKWVALILVEINEANSKGGEVVPMSKLTSLANTPGTAHTASSGMPAWLAHDVWTRLRGWRLVVWWCRRTVLVPVGDGIPTRTGLAELYRLLHKAM